ncbi:MAG: hypothetical protein MZW92_76420 [Comamonadaceae bacterium]|nr:hypothetical protein [Comamonadaceae bacterium]
MVGRGRAQRCTPTRRRMLERDRRGALAAAPAAVFGFFPANAVGRRHRDLRRRAAHQAARRRWHNLRQQTSKPQGQPNHCLADFVAPAGVGRRRLRRRLRRHRRHRHRRRARASSRRAHDDYIVDHAQGAGRPAGRGLRRAPARARARASSGATRADEQLEQRAT